MSGIAHHLNEKDSTQHDSPCLLYYHTPWANDFIQAAGPAGSDLQTNPVLLMLLPLADQWELVLEKGTMKVFFCMHTNAIASGTIQEP